jgi:hypothetical protein
VSECVESFVINVAPPGINRLFHTTRFVRDDAGVIENNMKIVSSRLDAGLLDTLETT